nr:hypothetical protein [Nostoc sp. ChiQUE02]
MSTIVTERLVSGVKPCRWRSLSKSCAGYAYAFVLMREKRSPDNKLLVYKMLPRSTHLARFLLIELSLLKVS